MPDPRVQKLAQVLVQYSLSVKAGDKLALRGPANALPLLYEVYSEAVRSGAFVTYRITDPNFEELLLKEGSLEQLKFFAPQLMREVEEADTLLSIWSESNTKQFSQIDPERLALRKKTLSPATQRMMQRYGEGKLRWSGTLYPTESHAQDANMSLRDYQDFVYGAGLLHEADPIAAWRRVHDQQQHIVDFLNTCKHIRIVAPDTDIEYRCEGRTWINCDGKENFPDGEVFTGPLEDSVNGHVRFTYPSVYNGREAEDVRLTFKDGKVVEATAARGQEFLETMLNMDAGARILGEAAFGLNYGIERFTRNILFDEKIGGTMHMALGASYPETGAKNQSGLHWDMVCDLHQGEVYADGELCYQAGKFII
ncbi:MAG TPA: aminopeptidase [Herpetosiphonaceae bacterium]